MRLEFDVWENPTRSLRFEKPSHSQIMDIIEKVDGDKLDLFALVKDELHYLAVGGGSDGRYICYTREGESPKGGELCYNINLPSSSSVDVSLKVGGQWGDFPESMIVSVDDVRKICSHYLQHGTRHPDYEWKRNY